MLSVILDHIFCYWRVNYRNNHVESLCWEGESVFKVRLPSTYGVKAANFADN